MDIELPRLEFRREQISSYDDLSKGIITPAFQGKIFYTNNTGIIYTQSRDSLGKKLYIRASNLLIINFSFHQLWETYKSHKIPETSFKLLDFIEFPRI